MSLNTISIEVAVIVLIASAVAALTDISRFKVYNVLTIPVLLSGLMYHTFLDGWSGLALSAAGVAFGLIVFLLPYVMGGMGAGDVKFVAALGAWVGIAPLAIIVFFGCLATGIYALILLCGRGGFRQLWFNMQLMMLRFASVGRMLIVDDKMESVHDWTQSPERRRRLIPFTAMIAVGVIITVVLAYSLSQSSVASSQ